MKDVRSAIQNKTKVRQKAANLKRFTLARSGLYQTVTKIITSRVVPISSNLHAVL